MIGRNENSVIICPVNDSHVCASAGMLGGSRRHVCAFGFVQKNALSDFMI